MTPTTSTGHQRGDPAGRRRQLGPAAAPAPFLLRFRGRLDVGRLYGHGAASLGPLEYAFGVAAATRTLEQPAGAGAG